MRVSRVVETSPGSSAEEVKTVSLGFQPTSRPQFQASPTPRRFSPLRSRFVSMNRCDHATLLGTGFELPPAYTGYSAAINTTHTSLAAGRPPPWNPPSPATTAVHRTSHRVSPSASATEATWRA